ncbi:hypothetical protein ACLSZM_04030 [Avibacterium avium]|uniref:hypothetical protein n=1 Tax=Avibacterium avium TaxID=751 RepID=UPI003BF83AE6
MIVVPFSLLPFFWERKRKEVAQRAKPVIYPKEKSNLTIKPKLYFLHSGTQKKGSRSTSETRYLSQRKKQFNDKTKILLFFIRERKRK